MFKGELYFDDGELINVPSFIVRSETEIAFSLIANWAGQGRWRKTGSAFRDGIGYKSDSEPAVQVETGEKGPPCVISFVSVEVDGDFLSVKGAWREEGLEHGFSGDLEVSR